MSYKTKTITADCGTCPLCSTNDMGEFICSWGANKKVKIMKQQKGKNVLHCKLKGRE